MAKLHFYHVKPFEAQAGDTISMTITFHIAKADHEAEKIWVKAYRGDYPPSYETLDGLPGELDLLDSTEVFRQMVPSFAHYEIISVD